MMDPGTVERRARGGLVEELRQNEQGAVEGMGLRDPRPLLIDRLYFEGCLGKEPEAGRRYQAALALAELYQLVHPSAGVGRYAPIGRSGGEQSDDCMAQWNSQLNGMLRSLQSAHSTLLCNVCARNEEPKALELKTLRQALDALVDYWERG